jgi:hypothetical protein
MYLNSNAGGAFHLWRQRFAEDGAFGEPEQITSGPTEEEGITMSADGRSFVTAVGLAQSSVWLLTSKGEHAAAAGIHTQHSGTVLEGEERQISLEGYAEYPKFTPDGKKLLYIVRDGSDPGQGILWMAELETGRSEPLLPGLPIPLGTVSYLGAYDLSPDSAQVVLESMDRERKTRLWIAPLNRGSAPRAIPGVEGDGPIFLPEGDILFRRREGDYGSMYRVRPDGTGLQQAVDYPVIHPMGISPDGEWITAYARPGEDKAGGTVALSLRGAPPVALYGRSVAAQWTRDGRSLLLSMRDSTQTGRSYIVPLPRGRALPAVPPGGFPSEDVIANFPGVRVLDFAYAAPGPAPGLFAFTRRSVQRNLYRIPVP